MLTFLSKCDQIFQQLQCPLKNESCQDCFTDAYYNGGQDDYSCLKGCYYYAMHYGPAYISEVYHFLSASKLLEKVGKGSIKIASMGGGIGTDLWAVKEYKKNNKLAFTGSYRIWDKEKQWQNVIDRYSSKIKIIPVDLSKQSVDFEDVDIVFINKLFSTLINQKLSNAFLDFLGESLKTLQKGAYIVFNDVNYKDKGRDKFHDFMLSLGTFSVQEQFYFPIFNAFTGSYKPINNTNIIYDCSSLSLSCDVMDTVRKTVFFYYKKDDHDY